MVTQQIDMPSIVDDAYTGTNPQRPVISDADHQLLTNALGWFSLGLGMMQLLMPGRLAEMIGLTHDRNTRLVMRLVGLREIASGIGILTQFQPVGWLWARVAGDGMDLALLGRALLSDDHERERTMAATASVLGVTLLDMLASEGFDPTHTSHSNMVHVRKSITINRPVEEVYRYWHNFENLPYFMSHLESVRVIGQRLSHWKTKAPGGMTVEWDAEILQDMPNELIVWRSLEGSQIFNAGAVQFRHAPGNRGTEVVVEMRYEAPAGKLGLFIAKMLGEEPEIQVADDLRTFKQVMETGEIVRSEGTVQGKRLVHRAAQPPQNVHELLGRK